MPKILLADDNADTVEILAAVLRKEGYEVIRSWSGAEAIEKVKLERPALILLDVMMPKMDGFEVCRIVKSDPATAEIPIVMVTAKADLASARRVRELGASGYLIKPISPADVVRKVNELLKTDPGRPATGAPPK